MRHKKLDKKLGRSPEHRQALMASLVCALIERKRITTSLAKAKQARRLAEKMVTLGRRGTLASRRRAIAKLRKATIVAKLLAEIVPPMAGRNGGYTRILKLGPRRSDGTEMVLLEWTGIAAPERKKRKKKEQKPGEEQKKA